MTNKEAIEKISCTPLMRSEYEHGELKEALSMAIEALEKQIPKEPKLIETYPNNLHLCPSCGSTFITRYDGAMNYCNNCGQAIDWRPEE